MVEQRLGQLHQFIVRCGSRGGAMVAWRVYNLRGMDCRMTTPNITFDDIQAAARNLSGQAHRTPVITSHRLNAQLGDAEVFIKAENFQRVGAFKFRGAYNAASQLSADKRSRG